MINPALHNAMGLNGDETPFPWQEQLLGCFVQGNIPPAVDIPTGLGKTAVMAIWLVARASGARVPRRLVYVVDRRAVVDQATEVAVSLRAFVASRQDVRQALGLSSSRPLPISTLRGQHADNKEWLEDPASPAIIVGTVDMIGSRLLFEGYGVSRKMRPYHAGLLGADALVVLDEAHLVPAFEQLLRTIADNDAAFRPDDHDLAKLVPPFKLLALSATGRTSGEAVFRLTQQDLEHPVVRKRLNAKKALDVQPLREGATLEEAVARRAWELSDGGRSPIRCIVFCDKRDTAGKATRELQKLAKGVVPDLQLFVGGRRVFERENAKQWLSQRGFLAGSKPELKRPAFVFATSAGEVGIDLDADHMVCDLVAWERMVQRLGRVNRRGEPPDRVAVVHVILDQEPDDVERVLGRPRADRTAKEMEIADRVERSRAAKKLLERLPRTGDDCFDASPGALRDLKQRATAQPELRSVLDAATTRAPLRPSLSRAVVDAWSMTSLKEHTGRPEVQPWLRGWVNEKPQTSVVWRRYLPVMIGGSAGSKKDVEAFFEAAPPHIIETLSTETYRAVPWLMARADGVAQRAVMSNGDEHTSEAIPPRLSDVVAVALTRAGDLRESWRLADLLDERALGEALRKASSADRAGVLERRGTNGKARRQKTKDVLERVLAGATLVVDRRLGGLGAKGLLDAAVSTPTDTVDDDDRTLCRLDDGVPTVRFRVWCTADAPSTDSDDRWRPRFRLAIGDSEDGEGTYLVVDKWRQDAATEDDRSAARRLQFLETHQEWAEDLARCLAKDLGLDDYAEMLAVAARLHDEGKGARRWQRAFNAPSDGVYAKTRGPIGHALLDGYRHELGSVVHVENDRRLLALTDEQRDLALHLIAAHHGFARPVIGTNGCDDAPPSALEGTAREIALRFARLQKRWGPWGLTWWESLLRAADQQASRRNESEDC